MSDQDMIEAPSTTGTYRRRASFDQVVNDMQAIFERDAFPGSFALRTDQTVRRQWAGAAIGLGSLIGATGVAVAAYTVLGPPSLYRDCRTFASPNSGFAAPTAAALLPDNPPRRPAAATRALPAAQPMGSLGSAHKQRRAGREAVAAKEIGDGPGAADTGLAGQAEFSCRNSGYTDIAQCPPADTLDADRALGAAYQAAIHANVDEPVLARYSERWSRLRAHAKEQPAETAETYRGMAQELTALVQRSDARP